MKKIVKQFWQVPVYTENSSLRWSSQVPKADSISIELWLSSPNMLSSILPLSSSEESNDTLLHCSLKTFTSLTTSIMKPYVLSAWSRWSFLWKVVTKDSWRFVQSKMFFAADILQSSWALNPERMIWKWLCKELTAWSSLKRVKKSRFMMRSIKYILAYGALRLKKSGKLKQLRTSWAHLIFKKNLKAVKECPF